MPISICLSVSAQFAQSLSDVQRCSSQKITSEKKHLGDNCTETDLFMSLPETSPEELQYTQHVSVYVCIGFRGDAKPAFDEGNQSQIGHLPL